MDAENPQVKDEQATHAPEKTEVNIPDKIIIRMWLKTPVLYPIAVFALICSIVGSISGFAPNVNELKKQFNAPATEQEAESSEALSLSVEDIIGTAGNKEIVASAKNLIDSLYIDRILGIAFLVLLAFTLFTLCLDLEVRWAMVLFSGLVIAILLLYIANLQYQFIPDFISKLFAISPMASPQFYASIFVIWLILMILSLVVVRFHYVKVESNEIIVIGGMLERQKRFPTSRMHYSKDIQDVFEYYLPLVNSGRLIISFSDHPESIVIDNVMHIDKITKQLDDISGVMQVRS